MSFMHGCNKRGVIYREIRIGNSLFNKYISQRRRLNWKSNRLQRHTAGDQRPVKLISRDLNTGYEISVAARVSSSPTSPP